MNNDIRKYSPLEHYIRPDTEPDAAKGSVSWE